MRCYVTLFGCIGTFRWLIIKKRLNKLYGALFSIIFPYFKANVYSLSIFIGFLYYIKVRCAHGTSENLQTNLFVVASSIGTSRLAISFFGLKFPSLGVNGYGLYLSTYSDGGSDILAQSVKMNCF